MTEIYNDATKKHDALLLFEVNYGNPNGDPDADNAPRTDPETEIGLVTGESTKRKIRDYVSIVKQNNKERYSIYIENQIALNDRHSESYKELGIKSTGTKQKKEDIEAAGTWMCNRYYDVRTFGAVMSTGVNCGNFTGPVQIAIGQSCDPIKIMTMTITRKALTDANEIKVSQGADGKIQGGKNNTMGRKKVTPFGLYKQIITVNPFQAKNTGFDNQDLELLWESVIKMYNYNHSATRGIIIPRGLYIFSHEDPYGNAHCHKLIESIEVTKKENVTYPRSFTDYQIKVSEPPTGVSLNILE